MSYIGAQSRSLLWRCAMIATKRPACLQTSVHGCVYATRTCQHRKGSTAADDLHCPSDGCVWVGVAGWLCVGVGVVVRGCVGVVGLIRLNHKCIRLSYNTRV